MIRENTLEAGAFTASNPPKSVDEANVRGALLDQDIERIITSFEVRTPASFQTPEEYVIWKQRASDILGSKRTEFKFISGWLSEERRLAKANGRKIQKEELLDLAKRLNIEIAFVPEYYVGHLPEKFDKLQERWKELLDFKRKGENAMQEIRGVSLEISHRPTGAFFRAKSVVTKTLSRIEAELALLKSVKSALLGYSAAEAAKNGIPLPVSSVTLTPEEHASVRQQIGMLRERLAVDAQLDVTEWLHKTLEERVSKDEYNPELGERLALIGEYLRLLRLIRPKHD